MYLDRTTKQYYFQMTVPGMSLNRVQILEGLAEKIGMPVRTEKLIINVEKENVNVENRAEGSIDLTEVQVKSLSVMPFELQGAETALVIEVRGAPIEYFSSIGALNTIIKLKEDKDLDLWSRVEGENAREGVLFTVGRGGMVAVNRSQGDNFAAVPERKDNEPVGLYF